MVDEVYHAISPNPDAFTPPAGSQADDLEAFDQPSSSHSIGILFESFLQTINHVFFLFSESQLRRRFGRSECVPVQDISADMCLVLALGAKYSTAHVARAQNEWYKKARLQLLSEDSENDMWMMRVLANDLYLRDRR